MVRDVLRDPARLEALAETGLLDAPPHATLDRCARIAQAALGAALVQISLVDDHRQFFASSIRVGEPQGSCRETPLTHSFCQYVVTGDQPLVVEDARCHPLVRDNPAVREVPVVAYAGMPIRVAGGHVLGSLCAIEPWPRVWSARDLAVLADLAAVVSDELDLRRQAVRAVRAELRLGEVNRRLREEHVSESKLAASASHDLRTPLSVIALGVGHLADHEAIQAYPELRRLAGTVQRNVDHAASLLSSMQPFAALDGAGDPRAIVDLARLAREICADLGVPGSSTRVDCSGVGRGPVGVRCDGTSLRRCVENLVTNALRFARSTVAVSVSQASAGSVLEVEDDGAGLPDAEAYRRAWETHTRFHVREGLSGSGLGLAIVREIVRRHGGHVEATRSRMGGARFALHFPLAG